MVPGDSKRVSGCKPGRIGIAVLSEVYGTGQSRFNGSPITDTVQPAVFGELPVMDCEDDV